ncbi:MAG TPA: D-alanyl-D-alanine carboxypeptidase family protein [Solirubrobacterales bacterium]|jgi:D-alanyl-D-alanine carboxypeptidase (penicillin-binding protein 5/6)|nr:D-alanyl-D-alanine carboxypeptidase family protein [Solirubrobacterales bacterium]
MRRRRVGALLAVLLCLASCGTAAAAQPSQGKGGKAKRHPAPGPRVLAKSWALIDGRTGEVLTSHAGDERRLIASTTKLMTAYVAIKDLPLGKIVRAQPFEYEYGDSVMGLRPGQRISVHDLLRGLIMLSAGDAAHTLAIEAAGTVKKFVGQMNRYAAALGLTNTHYENPIGLDSPTNYSSALDLASLTEELLKIPAFAKIADSREATLKSMRPVEHIHSINELLEMAPWVTGVKTGHTWKAGYVLVGSGSRHGVKLIAVDIDAPTDETRFSDALELLEWGFRQYHRRKALHKGQELASASIRYSGGELPLVVAHSLKVGLRKGQKVAVEVDAPRRVTGPIRRGAPLGTATVSVGGLRAGTVKLVASRRIPAAGSFDRARGFVSEHLVTLVLAACAILIAAMLLGRFFRRIRRGKRVQQK